MSFLKVNGYLPERGKMRLRHRTPSGPTPNEVWCRTEQGLVSDLSKQPFSRRETTFPACCQDVVRRDSLAIPGLACRVGGMTFPA